jgi:hypothetical protein
MATFSICEIMVLNPRKLKSVFSMTTFSPSMSVSMMFMFRMERLIGAENCGSFSRTKAMA